MDGHITLETVQSNLATINESIEKSLYTFMIKDFQIPGARQMTYGEDIEIKNYIRTLIDKLEVTQIVNAHVSDPSFAALVVPEVLTVKSQVSPDATLALMEVMIPYYQPNPGSLMDMAYVNKLVAELDEHELEYRGLSDLVLTISGTDTQPPPNTPMPGPDRAANQRLDYRRRIGRARGELSFGEGPNKIDVLRDVTTAMMVITVTWKHHKWA